MAEKERSSSQSDDINHDLLFVCLFAYGNGNLYLLGVWEQGCIEGMMIEFFLFFFVFCFFRQFFLKLFVAFRPMNRRYV